MLSRPYPVRRPPRNDFERARLAKVLSVDPQGVARSDVDGDDRAGVFALLTSFDGEGLDERAFERAAAGLFGASSAAEYHARFVAHACRLELAGDDGEAAGETLAEAEAIVAHRFTFNGETHQLPAEIDWAANPGNAHWGCELNRFGFLETLTTAWEATGNRRYAAEAVGLILHWIARTDICHSFQPGPDPAQWRTSIRTPGIWLSHLEIGYHSVAWSRTLARLVRRDPGLVAPAELLRIAKSVHDQVHWLEMVVPEGGHGNGLTAGAMCQLAILAHWPGLRGAGELAATALDRVVATLDRQVLPDGIQHELTPHYHFCVVRDLLVIREAAVALGLALPSRFDETLRRMLHAVRQTITPDGLQVAFGDADAELGGWVRQTLARPVVAELLGSGPADGLPELRAECFPRGGWVFLREGSAAGRDELYLAFNAGPYGNCHQHEDALSIWLTAYGRTFLVDPGRHQYDERSYYPYLRSTRAHSTIRIDDCDQNAKAHPGRYVAREPLPIEWRDDAGQIVAAATYDLGYGPAQIAVRHRRRVVFRREERWWQVDDWVEGEGVHRIESRFQFAPCHLVLETAAARTGDPGPSLSIEFGNGSWDEARIEEGQENPRGGWYSPRMNVIRPAPALVLSATRALPFHASYRLVPRTG